MEYYRPDNLDDALNWLADNDAAIAAGCSDLLAATQSHFLHKNNQAYLLDITAIDQLRGIAHLDDGIWFGAATCWSDIIAARLPPSFDGLKAAAREVGSVQIQNTGTIGGNLCNASPAADGVPPLLTLDARVELVSRRGSRQLPLDEFLLGVRQTALARDEILAAIIVPNSATDGVSKFIKLGARKYLVISIAMVAVRMEFRRETISDIAISVGSCSAVACRLRQIESDLRGQNTTSNFDNIVTEQSLKQILSPIDDIRADAPYRIKAARQLILQCIDELIIEPEVSA